MIDNPFPFSRSLLDMPDTIGKLLQQARLARGQTLDEAAQATHIRARYLQALEEDRVDEFPSAVHRKGFLRNYAEYLKVTLELPSSSPPPPIETPKPENKNTQKEQPRSSSPVVEAKPPKPLPALTPPQESQKIFIEIGQTLQRQREQLGLSLTDVENHTHLRLHYLKAMEEGDLSSLPSTVQSRGMLSNYARFLNIDPDTLLDRFADALQTRREELISTKVIPASPKKKKPVQTTPPNPLQRVFSLDLLLGSGLIIFLVAFIIFAATQVLNTQSETQDTVDAPDISDMLLETVEPDTSQTVDVTSASTTFPTATVGLMTATPEITGTVSTMTPDAGTTGDIQVYVISTARTWMRVTVDGDIAFEGRTSAGGAYPFGGNKKIELVTGNAGNLQVYYNQNDLGVLGGIDEIVDLIFTVDGQQTPTPTITPTVTLTPRFTATSTASSTPTTVPSVTPIPSVISNSATAVQ